MNDLPRELISDVPLEFSSKSDEQVKKIDQLKRTELIKHLYNLVIDNQSKNSICIGIIGPWGSGKTSLLNHLKYLVETKYLVEEESQKKPIIVEFNPWSLTNKENILKQFLHRISEVLIQNDFTQHDSTQSDTSNISGKTQVNPPKPGLLGGTRIDKQLWSKLVLLVENSDRAKEKIGSTLKIISDFIGKVSSDDTPKLNLISGAIGALATLVGHGLTVDEVRSRLKELLAKIEQPIWIFIDDIDRLEPEFARQIIALVKSVVDLPNTFYFIPFDSLMLAKAFSISDQVEADAYLSKLIQIPVYLPEPSKEDLSKIFYEEIERIYNKTENGIKLFDDATIDKEKINQVFQEIKPLLSNVRQIKRFSNSLALVENFLQSQVDYRDLWRLEAIKVVYPSIFSKIFVNVDLFTWKDSIYEINYESQDKELQKNIDEMVENLDLDLKNSMQKLFNKIFPRLDKIIIELDSLSKKFARHKSILESYLNLTKFSSDKIAYVSLLTGDNADNNFSRTLKELFEQEPLKVIFLIKEIKNKWQSDSFLLGGDTILRIIFQSCDNWMIELSKSSEKNGFCEAMYSSIEDLFDSWHNTKSSDTSIVNNYLTPWFNNSPIVFGSIIFNLYGQHSNILDSITSNTFENKFKDIQYIKIPNLHLYRWLQEVMEKRTISRNDLESTNGKYYTQFQTQLSST